MDEDDDGRKGTGGEPPEPGLGARLREAWAWYREDLKTSGLSAGTPEEQTARVNGAVVVIAALLLGIAVFKGAPGPVVMIFAMGALIVVARARKGRDEEARRRYGRLESFAEAVLLFFLVILMAEAILPKYF